MRRHRHDLPYLLCILEGTRVDAEVDGRGAVEIPVQPGSVFFVPPGATETAVNNSRDHFREILIELKKPATEAMKVVVANAPARQSS